MGGREKNRDKDATTFQGALAVGGAGDRGGVDGNAGSRTSGGV